MRAADLPRRSLADKFLNVAIEPSNAYQCAEFEPPSSIHFGDTEGVQKLKLGAADLPRRLYRPNFYMELQYLQMPTSILNFNFLALIVSEIKRVSQNLMWGLLPSPPRCRTPYAETFTYTPSTWQGKTASQISASYLYASCSYANMYFP